MIEAGAWVTIALLVALYVLFFVVDLDVNSRVAARKLEKHQDDFGRAFTSIRDHIRRHGEPFQPTADNALPAEEFITHTAMLIGGANIDREHARYARLDVFSDPPYSEPLLYVTFGSEWALASRGPDGELHTQAEQLRAWLQDPTENQPLIYDPANGTVSQGDLIMSSLQAVGPGFEQP